MGILYDKFRENTVIPRFSKFKSPNFNIKASP